MRHLVICLLVLCGCERLPELPATFRYEVELKDDSPTLPKETKVFVGWSVFAKGQKLGVLTSGQFGPRLTLEAPAATPIEKVFDGAELHSPCGKIIALSRPIKPKWQDSDGKPADEKKYARSLYKYHLQDLEAKKPGVGQVMTISLSAVPAEIPVVSTPHPVLIARGGVTDELTIGAMAVDVSVNRVEVAGDCGDDLPVKVAGKEIGVWSSKNEATFIALAKDACFLDRVVTYGENPYGDGGTLLRGPGVFAIGREPDFFLAKAPTSVGVVQGTKTDMRRELDFAPCPP